jgi:hypothetical protein
MGHAGKTRRHGQKMRAKRAAKAQRRAEYASRRGTSKKAKKQGTVVRFSSGKHQHLIEHCGNVGCSRCYPEFRKLSHKELAARAQLAA